MDQSIERHRDGVGLVIRRRCAHAVSSGGRRGEGAAQAAAACGVDRTTGRCDACRVAGCRDVEVEAQQPDRPRALTTTRKAVPLSGPQAILALQRSAGNHSVVRALGPRSLARQPQGATQAPARLRAPAAAPAAPRLDLRPSVNGPACGCIVFMHNNERNARLTAELLHRHCRYNLVVVEPDNRQRHIQLPRTRGTVDPNELFPRAVIEQCLGDPQPCRDFVAANSASTGPAVIRSVAERQFFLALHDGSNGFRLPVVALHNNTVDDTARYRAARPRPRTAAVSGRTFGQTPGDGVRPVQEVRDWLTQNFDQQTVQQMTGRPGTTNVFRWCLSPDIARCHIGDPDRPDTVVWVTNEADFRRLSSQPINVVLQSGAATTGESATDLSTLFLTAGELVNTSADQLLEQLRTPEGSDDSGVWGGLRRFGRAVVEGARRERLANLRYINIETPQAPTRAGQTQEQLRDESFSSILLALRAAGLDCCSQDPGTGEAAVRAGLS